MSRTTFVVLMLCVALGAGCSVKARVTSMPSRAGGADAGGGGVSTAGNTRGTGGEPGSSMTLGGGNGGNGGVAARNSASSGAGGMMTTTGGAGVAGAAGATAAACETLTCADGSCVERHTVYDECGCEMKSCQDGLCVRGACSGALVMDLAHVGPPLAIDGSSAYGLDANETRVVLYRIDDDAQKPVVVSKLDIKFIDISRPVIDATYLYFVIDTQSGRHVYRTLKAGGAYEELAHEGTTSTNEIDIAVDETYVYWRGENGIFRVPLAGGDPLNWQHLGCGQDLTVAKGWAYFSCNGTMYRRRTSETNEVSSFDLVPFAANSYNPDSTTYWSGYPVVAGDTLYYLNGRTVEAVSLTSDEMHMYMLPGFVAVLDIWVDGERLFATVLTDRKNVTSYLVEFPKLGEPTYKLIADLASNLGRIDGFTPKWLYLHPYSDITRIPRP